MMRTRTLHLAESLPEAFMVANVVEIRIGLYVIFASKASSNRPFKASEGLLNGTSGTVQACNIIVRSSHCWVV